MMYKNRFTVQSTPFTMFTICSPVSTGRQVFSKSHTNAMSTGRQVKVFSKSHTNAMYTGQQVFFKSHTNAMSTGRQVDRSTGRQVKVFFKSHTNAIRTLRNDDGKPKRRRS